MARVAPTALLEKAQVEHRAALVAAVRSLPG